MEINKFDLYCLSSVWNDFETIFQIKDEIEKMINERIETNRLETRLKEFINADLIDTFAVTKDNIYHKIEISNLQSLWSYDVYFKLTEKGRFLVDSRWNGVIGTGVDS